MTHAQITEFDERGFLFFPSLLDAADVDAMQRDMPELLARTGPEVIHEKTDSDAARLVFGSHEFSDAFGTVSLRACILNPVRQLL